jgi:hypothetical protein
MKPGYDDNVNEEIYNIGRMMRASFVRAYVGNNAELYFAMALESARFDDCLKDIERGRVSLKTKDRIIRDAINHGIITDEFARMRLLY